jgi:uncharacterized protein with GYD domain
VTVLTADEKRWSPIAGFLPGSLGRKDLIPSCSKFLSGGAGMMFVVLGRFRKQLTKESVNEINKYVEKIAKEGVKFKAMYWLLGRYDTIGIFEAPDEKIAMKAMLGLRYVAKTETLVAVPREEAAKLLE